MNTESFVGPLHKQKEVLQEEQQIQNLLAKTIWI